MITILKRLIYLVPVLFITAALISFIDTETLKGAWQYQGGTENGTVSGAPVGYTMRRVYTDKDFNAYVIQKGYKTERYEAGTYILKGDTCFETTTFSSQPSQLVGKTVAYIYAVKNNVLTLSSTLPSGAVVQDNWSMVLSAKKK